MTSVPKPLFSKFKSISGPSLRRQVRHTATPGDGSQSGIVHAPPAGESSFGSQARTINVVLCGGTYVGRRFIINLLAQKEIAPFSSDVNSSTMQSTRYDVSFDGVDFAIFDIIGLEEPQMGVKGYLRAIEKAYEFIMKLDVAGGIHLLLFCMRGARITATVQSNYRLFCECFCNAKVPIALAFTDLEREMEMEDWWVRHKTHIEQYGIRSNGHTYVTMFLADTQEEYLKYLESQRRICELLKTYALQSFSEPHGWFVKLGKGMRSYIKGHKKPEREDLIRVLTQRCKVDLKTAEEIAGMMEEDDTEDGDQERSKEQGRSNWGHMQAAVLLDPPGNPEAKSDHRTAYVLGAEKSRTINVVLFGESDVGKNFIINLIAQREIAQVSLDVDSCAMQSTRYDISFDGIDFAIFDTVGLEEPQMGVNSYLMAIEKAHELVMKLSAAGGIHLLLFCARKGRTTATTQRNYRLLRECFNNTKIPIAFVFTGPGREVELEDWRARNKAHMEHYGIGQVCIRIIPDATHREYLKYTESRKNIRELLKVSALQDEAFSPELYSWFGRFGGEMRIFIEKSRVPKTRDVMRVLMRRCKLDLETATKIASLMEGAI